jgi:hypothetical protein
MLEQMAAMDGVDGGVWQFIEGFVQVGLYNHAGKVHKFRVVLAGQGAQTAPQFQLDRAPRIQFSLHGRVENLHAGGFRSGYGVANSHFSAVRMGKL